MKREDFHVTYCVSGLLKGGEGIGVFLASQESLDDVKGKFTVCTSHVYSIAPVRPRDVEVLADRETTAAITHLANKYSGITNDRIAFVERQRRPTSAASIKPQQPMDTKKPEPSKSGEAKASIKAVSKGIQSMFAKAESTASKPPLSKPEPKKSNATSSKVNGSSKVKGAVKKGTSGKAIADPEPEDEVQRGRKTKGSGKRKIEDSDSGTDVENFSLLDDAKIATVNPADHEDAESNESEEDMQRRESHLEVDDTPMVEAELESAAVTESTQAEDAELTVDKTIAAAFQDTPKNVPKGRRRYKKIVSKTYRDEKGYIVTKDEEVIVSESENESQATNRPIKAATKVAPPVKPVAPKVTTANPDAESETSKKSSGKGKGSGGGSAVPKKDDKGASSGQKSLLSFFVKK
ncbi:hypothetical protein HDU93_003327 [Gonapodya sp. JEL0774]|nr:hypothetical protein HDU93_003327 [Gonapodya sp. JEL0774]